MCPFAGLSSLHSRSSRRVLGFRGRTRVAHEPAEDDIECGNVTRARAAQRVAKSLRSIVVVPAGPESVPGLAASFGSMTNT